MVGRMKRTSFFAHKAPFLLAGVVASSVAACGLDNADGLFGASGSTSGTTGSGGSSTTTGTGGGAGTGGSTTSVGGGGSSTTGSGGMGGVGGAPVGCGNGVHEGMEECDGADLNGKSCADFGYSNPSGLGCDPSCHFDSSSCKTICDGTLEPGEVCDGMNLNGHTCSELGFSNAAGLKCVGCQLDSSGCKSACNGMLEPGEVCDGANLNNHTCLEFGSASPNGLSCKNCQLDPSTCSASCGNGMLEPGEICDSPHLDGHTCQELGYSNPLGLTCTNCALDPTGCVPTCNNGMLEPTEVCDGNNLQGHTCTDLMFSNPAGLKCAAGCQGFDPSGCKPTCNNGTLEPTELCDGNNLGGKSCTDFGFNVAAGLKCAAGCASFDTSNCTSMCNNNGVVDAGEICDGANLNGHSCAELGYANPAGMICVNCALNSAACIAVCGNGTKEPGEQCDDGNILPNDGCSSACVFEASACASATPVALALGTQVLNGTTVGGGAHTGTVCQGSDGPDRIFAVTALADGFLTASLGRGPTNYDSVLYASASCSDANPNTSILCADSYDVPNNLPLDGGEVLSFKVTIGQQVYLFVDGYGADDFGNFQLTLDLSTGVDCNDPVPIPLEPGAPMRMLGTTVGAGSTAAGSCSGSSGNNPDVVYRVTRSSNGTLGVTAPGNLSNYNVVLYSRSTCGSGNSQIACANNGGNSATETLAPTNVSAGVPIFIWVDGSSNGTGSGTYGLTMTP
jgi:cysteine-rich repeat protein